MNQFCQKTRMVICGMFVAALLVSPVSHGDSRQLTHIAGQIAHGALGGDHPWIIRTGEIDLDLAALHDLALNAHEKPVIELQLFNDTVVPVRINYAEFREEDRFSMAGSVPKAIGSSAVISVCVDAAYGVISVPPMLFEIRRVEDGGHQVTEFDESLMPPCGLGKADIELPEPPRAAGGRQAAGGTPVHHVPEVNVMVVYTPAARNSAGGINGMLAMIDTAILQTNQALAASHAGMLVNLTSAYEVNYVESNNMGDDLTHLQNPNSGQMDIVHSLRVADCADLVALLSHNPNYNYCGLAWMPSQPVQNNPGYWANWAFSATWTNCIPNMTFAHELAHNLGCHHDHNNATGNSSYPYAYGHRFTGNSATLWRTVMAYAPGSRIAHYSNPNIFFDGVATGIPAGSPDPADNAQAIANNAPDIATYRSLIGGNCPPVVTCHWDNTSGIVGLNGPVRALVEYNDGTGMSLYAGGLFTQAGGQPALHVARWDGSQWHPVGLGLAGEVLALAVFDDGSGPSLYAGGTFAMPSPGGPIENIARWDVPSSQWMPVGFGLLGTVNSLAVFNDGTGDALYAGGLFTAAGGGNPVNRIAAWDGNQWSPVGGGVGAVASDQVVAMTVHHDPTFPTPALYVGGRFNVVDFGIPAENIARWDGAAWSSLANGLDNTVIALKSFDDGTGFGAQLYAGGIFLTSAGVQMNHIARWHAGQWHSLGNGLPGPSSGVAALEVFNDGAGDRLFVGGQFSLNVTGGTIHNATAWDQFNQDWLVLSDGVNASVDALAVHDDGSGAKLFAGGHFTASGYQPANFIAAWDGCVPPPTGCITCPPGSLAENEPCGTHLNDFCNQFATPVTCGDTVCGTLWFDSVPGAIDFDRYELSLGGSGQTVVDIEIEPDIDVTVWVDNGLCPGDPAYQVYGNVFTVAACTLAAHSVVVGSPGVYYINVQAAGMPATCPNESLYVLQVNCTTTGPTNAVCVNATPIIIPPSPLAGPSHSIAVEFDNFGAVTDGPPDADCAFTGVDDSDVWFDFTATHNGPHMMTIEYVAGNQPDRLMAVYGGGCPQAGHARIACTQANGGAAGCVIISMAAGDSAIIRVGTVGGTAGQGLSRLTLDACPADLNGDGAVDVSDLLITLSNWGQCPATGVCQGDLNCDGVVDVSDLLVILANWGSCP